MSGEILIAVALLILIGAVARYDFSLDRHLSPGIVGAVAIYGIALAYARTRYRPSDCPPDLVTVLSGGVDIHTVQWQQGLMHLSPTTLFNDSAITLLSPSTRSLGPVFLSQIQGALLGSPLPLSESLALVWPQFTGLIAACIMLFTAGYVVFQRQEIRT
ncbi:hypothetical protein KVP09_01245 [Alcaligenaceae bacterium CGII-47]|nr:hypothetical protein [Alcaligenaceae bacterium CGII-47]